MTGRSWSSIPFPFEQSQPKRAHGLSQVARLIGQKKLLDLTTVDTLERIAKLRNSVVHRGATYSVPFRDGDPSRGEYKARHVFTDSEGLLQLMDDVDAATKIIGERLRKTGLGVGKQTPNKPCLQPTRKQPRAADAPTFGS